MILSVSRRTDIPNYYSEWFLRRMREGYVYVRNPYNPHQVSSVLLNPDTIDGIVFWSKNPLPLMESLDMLADYPYYVQFTLTGYGHDIEPGLPDKREVLIPAFRELSKRIGNERVIWRYDPILFQERYPFEYHVRAFEQIAEALYGYTKRVVISFLDMYAKTKQNTKELRITEPCEGQIRELAGMLSSIAAAYGMQIESCAEKMDLKPEGVQHGRCIDPALFAQIPGYRVGERKDRNQTDRNQKDKNQTDKNQKDKNQRKECGCMASVEIGAYDTCRTGCLYCYANEHKKKVEQTIAGYDVASPFLCSRQEERDVIRLRCSNRL